LVDRKVFLKNALEFLRIRLDEWTNAP
jgi:hypothetical protein